MCHSKRGRGRRRDAAGSRFGIELNSGAYGAGTSVRIPLEITAHHQSQVQDIKSWSGGDGVRI